MGQCVCKKKCGRKEKTEELEVCDDVENPDDGKNAITFFHLKLFCMNAAYTLVHIIGNSNI